MERVRHVSLPEAKQAIFAPNTAPCVPQCRSSSILESNLLTNTNNIYENRRMSREIPRGTKTIPSGDVAVQDAKSDTNPLSVTCVEVNRCMVPKNERTGVIQNFFNCLGGEVQLNCILREGEI